MNILNEIADWRYEQVKRGNNPTEIHLTDDQKERLSLYVKQHEVFFLGLPSPLDGQVYGMKIV